MCGIYGAVAFNYQGRFAIDTLLPRLQEGARLRGRDGDGLFDWAWGYLGVSRAQPLPEGEEIPIPLKHGNLVMAFNGTISNDQELCEQYGLPKDDVDTWTAIRLWEKLGWQACNEFVGGFVFVVFDKTTGDLTLAKNFKTSWYVSTNDYFAFSSEPEPLYQSNLPSVHPCQPHRLPINRAVIIKQSWTTHRSFKDLAISRENRIEEHDIERKVWGSTPELNPNKAVIVTSGGIDSITSAYVAARHHGKEVTLVNFDYGQRARHREWDAVKKAAVNLECKRIQIDLLQLGDWGSSPLTDTGIELPLGRRSVESTLCWTPGRNMLMVAYAAAYAESIGAKFLYYGNNMEEEATGYSDNDLEFIHVFNELLQYGTLRGVVIHRALGRLMKKEILQVGDYLGVDYYTTWSCDEGGELPCGICGCCTTRRYAFIRSGLTDTQEYEHGITDKYPWEGAVPSDMKKLLALI